MHSPCLGMHWSKVEISKFVGEKQKAQETDDKGFIGWVVLCCKSRSMEVNHICTPPTQATATPITTAVIVTTNPVTNHS